MSRRPGNRPDAAQGLVEAITTITATSQRQQALQCVVDHACRLAGVRYGALLVVDHQGRPAEMYHHGRDVDTLSLSGLAGTPVTVRGQTLGLLYLADHDDGTELTDDESAVVRVLVSVAGYVLDHARNQRAAERRRVWQNQAATLSSTLQPPFDFASADRTVAEVALRAAGAVGCTIARLVEGEVVVTASAGTPPEWTRGVAHEAAVHAVLDGACGESEAGHDHVVLLASMQTHLSSPGVLAVYFPSSAPPDDVEIDLLSDFAAQAALSLDRARAFQEREQMSLVTDRDRIARELHDVVIQRLFATGLHLQKSRSLATDPELRERLGFSMQDLDQTIRAIRRSIFDLQGRTRRSVRADLRDVVSEFVDELGFVPTVRTDGPVDDVLTDRDQQALVEVLRQALSNVAQHAQASSATVQLTVSADHLVVEVSDDGRGLDPRSSESGLATLRTALDTRGGSLEVRGSEDGGTVLRCRIPLG